MSQLRHGVRNRQHRLHDLWRWGHGLLERSDLHLERHDAPLKVLRPLLFTRDALL
jgi:hypothetical protein